jgi:hypothetical protein
VTKVHANGHVQELIVADGQIDEGSGIVIKTRYVHSPAEIFRSTILNHGVRAPAQAEGVKGGTGAGDVANDTTPDGAIGKPAVAHGSLELRVDIVAAN